MISLKRNSKGVLVRATGLRSRDSSIYVPKQSEPFRIRRSKFNDFLTCKRCFYLDRVKGLVSPSMPGWTLNETTDLLLKKEFDLCREKQVPHRIFEELGLKSVVPFKHENSWTPLSGRGFKYCSSRWSRRYLVRPTARKADRGRLQVPSKQQICHHRRLFGWGVPPKLQNPA